MNVLNPNNFINPLNVNNHKMVKHTQRIRRLLPTNCLSVFDHFVGLALKELTKRVAEIKREPLQYIYIYILYTHSILMLTSIDLN